MFNMDLIKAHVEEKKAKKTDISEKLSAIGMTKEDIEDQRTNHDVFLDFMTKLPNVRMAKIRGTDYSFYFVPPDVMRTFIANKVQPSDDYDGPVLTKEEIGLFQYPSIRSSHHPGLGYDAQQHNGQ